MTLTELLATADYTGLSDAEAATLANQKRHRGNSFWTYKALMSESGIGIDATRRLIQTIDAAAASDPVVAEIRWSLREGTGVNANDASTRGMIDMMAANSQLPLTTQDATTIKGLADNQKSDAELYGLRVTIGAIERARA
jgi:hypothetical protein